MQSKTNLQEMSNREKVIQLVIFHIQEEEFGVPIEEIQEIIKVTNITPIPDAPKFIKGIINVRGDIVTTIDMKKRFSIKGKNGTDSRHIVITKQNDNLFGLMVDEVTEVLRIETGDIKSTPNLISQIDKDYVKGVVVYNDRLLILLDLAKVLSQEELARLTEIAKEFKQKPEQAPKEKPSLSNDELISLIKKKKRRGAPKKNSDSHEEETESE